MQSSDETRFQWHEISRGRLERDVDEPELFYTTLERLYQGTGRHMFAITGYIELRIQCSQRDSPRQTAQRVETALRQAWLSLRHDHPTLASFVEYDDKKVVCKKVYESLVDDEDGMKASAWLESTFQTVNDGMDGLEFCNSDPPLNKYPTLFLITPPMSKNVGHEDILRRDVVLRSHHDVIDGIGTLVLLNNLFSHAAKAYALQAQYPKVLFGNEFKNLSPPFRIAANIPTPTAAQKERLEETVAGNSVGAKNVEIIGVPFALKAEKPGRSKRAAINLTEEETERVLHRCKSAGVSITQAFHTGIIIAIRDLQERKDDERRGRYINYCLVNLRKHCVPPFNSTQHPVSVYHAASGKKLFVDVTIPSKDSPPENIDEMKAEFASILQVVKQFYTYAQADLADVTMVPLYFDAAIPPYPETVDSVPPPNMRPSVSISSIGVLDKIISPEHGCFNLSDPWVIGEELSTGIGAFLGTWKGKLCLSAVYNDAYHTKDDVIGFIETVKITVLRALDV